jgi:hypothetical protein
LKVQADARKLALEVIKEYRDGGCKLPPPPSLELIREMMNRLVCAEVQEEYLPMLLEEMELDARARSGRLRIHLSPAPAHPPGKPTCRRAVPRRECELARHWNRAQVTSR